MTFSVTQRIVGGFAILGTLLLIIGIAGFSGVGRINNQLSLVTDQATPMALYGDDVVINLLKANKLAVEFAFATDPAELASIRQNFSAVQDAYNIAQLQLTKLQLEDNRIRLNLNQGLEYCSTAFSNVKQIFDNHQLALEKKQRIEQLKLGFEAAVTELASGLQIAKEFATGEAALWMTQAIDELLIKINTSFIELLGMTDAEMLPDLVATVNVQAKSLQDRFDSLMQNDEETAIDLKARVAAILSSILDEDNLLRSFQSQFQTANEVGNALQALNKQVQQATDGLQQFVDHGAQAVENAREQAASTASTIRLSILVLAVFALAFAVIVALWVVNSIRRPLADVNAILSLMADGDIRQQLHINSKDEFGQLSASVNQLVEKLQQVIGAVNGNASEIANLVKGTVSISEQTTHDVGEQKHQTDQMASAMFEMNATVSEVAKSAEVALNEVIKAQEAGNNAQRVIAKNIELMKQLADTINNSATMVDQFDQHSISIGSMLDVIQSISGQINLLSLNAAIEAARAGEHGRGFAVVADEVRTLANRTKSSTEEIHSIIEKLQQSAEQASVFMINSRTQADSCVQQVSQAEHSLEIINQVINSVNDMSTQIASAAEQQAITANEIMRSVDAIAAAAGTTESGAKKTLLGGESLMSLVESQRELLLHFRV